MQQLKCSSVFKFEVHELNFSLPHVLQLFFSNLVRLLEIQSLKSGLHKEHTEFINVPSPFLRPPQAQ